jgi:ribosome biogenesis GTPase A
VARQSGALGKHDEERTRLACRYVLKQFRQGKFGRVNVDRAPRVS